MLNNNVFSSKLNFCSLLAGRNDGDRGPNFDDPYKLARATSTAKPSSHHTFPPQFSCSYVLRSPTTEELFILLRK